MTRVKFKKSKNPYTNEYEVICVFVDDVWTFPDKAEKMQNCYVHDGQHSHGMKEYFDHLLYATEEEYAPLLKELTEIVGYDDLEIIHG